MFDFSVPSTAELVRMLSVQDMKPPQMGLNDHLTEKS